MNTQNSQNEINIGVDTGAKQLDIYIHPLDIYFSVDNDEKGIKEGVKALKYFSGKEIFPILFDSIFIS